MSRPPAGPDPIQTDPTSVISPTALHRMADQPDGPAQRPGPAPRQQPTQVISATALHRMAEQPEGPAHPPSPVRRGTGVVSETALRRISRQVAGVLETSEAGAAPDRQGTGPTAGADPHLRGNGSATVAAAGQGARRPARPSILLRQVVILGVASLLGLGAGLAARRLTAGGEVARRHDLRPGTPVVSQGWSVHLDEIKVHPGAAGRLLVLKVKLDQDGARCHRCAERLALQVGDTFEPPRFTATALRGREPEVVVFALPARSVSTTQILLFSPADHQPIYLSVRLR